MKIRNLIHYNYKESLHIRQKIKERRDQLDLRCLKFKKYLYLFRFYKIIKLMLFKIGT